MEHSIKSSQPAEPLWTDPGLKSGISVRELISTLKRKKKSAVGEWIVEHSPKILAREEKATTTTIAAGENRQMWTNSKSEGCSRQKQTLTKYSTRVFSGEETGMNKRWFTFGELSGTKQM